VKGVIEYSRKLFIVLRGRIVAIALFKIFGRVIGGIWGIIATEIVGRLVDKIIKPIYKWSIRKLHVYHQSFNFKKKAIKLEEAKDEKSFNNSFDDLP